MPSFPLTPEQERAALKAIGVQSIEDLFASIPPQVREKAHFNFGEAERGLSEHELRQYFSDRAQQNDFDFQHFLGGGVYDNILPAIVNQLTLRGEFLTCYTPYQPEISQGTLQAIFEFQTLMARITGMEVANASLYDGATATAEAVMMAQRVSRQPQGQIFMAESLPPDYKAVVRTFLKGHSPQPIEVRWRSDGTLDRDHLQSLLESHNPCGLVVGYPNYFGTLEPFETIRSQLPDSCMLIACVPDPSILSIFEPPARLGADVTVGEAQQFGIPMSFGGPHAGFFATQKKYLRQVPGRLAGETVDARGKKAYALTLATREQHIRREKATSNICTNQGLMALRATIYLSFLGKAGFIELGEGNYSRFEYLKENLESHGIPLKFKGGTYCREGVFEVPNLKKRFASALEKKIIPGIPLAQKFPEHENALEHALLVAVHPKHTKTHLDQLVEVISHD